MAHGCEEHTERLLADRGAKGLVVVDAGDLGVAAAHVARLELLDQLVGLEIDREDPLSSDGLAPGR